MREYSEINYKGLKLRGFHDSGNDEVIAIITHGIGGNKLGHKFIFKQFADYAVQHGISVLRYDFAGSGESDGDFSNTKHSEQVEQVEVMISEAKNLGYSKIVLCSTTIGCYSVWHAKSEEYIIGYVNWNPIFNYDRYEEKSRANLEVDKTIDLKGLYLKQSYIKDLEELERKIPNHKKPVQVLQGELDGEYQFEDARNICKEYDWQYQVVNGGNHLLEGNEIRKNLFKHTVDFINRIS